MSLEKFLTLSFARPLTCLMIHLVSFHSIPSQDELLWAALWLYRSTKLTTYSNYLVNNGNSMWNMNEWGWDNKYAAIGVLFTTVSAAGMAALSLV